MCLDSVSQVWIQRTLHRLQLDYDSLLPLSTKDTQKATWFLDAILMHLLTETLGSSNAPATKGSDAKEVEVSSQQHGISTARTSPLYLRKELSCMLHLRKKAETEIIADAVLPEQTSLDGTRADPPLVRYLVGKILEFFD
jgi:hypothetical protein